MQVYPFRLDLNTALTLKFGPLTGRQGLFLHSSEGKSSFWGEINPLPGFSQESLADCQSQFLQLEAWLEQQAKEDLRMALLQGQNPWPFDLLPALEFGLAMALLWPFILSERNLQAIPINTLLAGTLPELLNQTQSCLNLGYTVFKLKVGQRTIAEDLARLQALAKFLPIHAKIRLDANQAWSLEKAIDFWEAAKIYPIEYIEEPLNNPAELQMLYQATAMPIALDESLGTKTDLNLGFQPQALILKPTCLGFLKTQFWVKEAKALKIPVVLTSCFESGLGLHFLGTLASYWQLNAWAQGLDTWRFLKNDPVSPPFKIEGGKYFPLQESPQLPIQSG